MLKNAIGASGVIIIELTWNNKFALRHRERMMAD